MGFIWLGINSRDYIAPEIDKGDYTFTFQSIKRKFKLREGEANYIQWNDDPYDADINVVAEYTAPNVRFSDLGTNNNPALSAINTNVKNYNKNSTAFLPAGKAIYYAAGRTDTTFI